jgi:hypothetical protein
MIQFAGSYSSHRPDRILIFHNACTFKNRNVVLAEGLGRDPVSTSHCFLACLLISTGIRTVYAGRVMATVNTTSMDGYKRKTKKMNEMSIYEHVRKCSAEEQQQQLRPGVWPGRRGRKKPQRPKGRARRSVTLLRIFGGLGLRCDPSCSYLDSSAARAHVKPTAPYRRAALLFGTAQVQVLVWPRSHLPVQEGLVPLPLGYDSEVRSSVQSSEFRGSAGETGGMEGEGRRACLVSCHWPARIRRMAIAFRTAVGCPLQI